MNAHSSIKREHRTDAQKRRMLNMARVTGLKEGFAAPVLLFAPLRFSRTNSVNASLEAAWKTVGDVLKASEQKEASKIGKTTRKAI